MKPPGKKTLRNKKPFPKNYSSETFYEMHSGAKRMFEKKARKTSVPGRK
jgi:hypothetical protein